MSVVKTTYSISEARQLLKICGYQYHKITKHEIWRTDDETLINQQKERFPLTITHDPVKRGTMLALIKFLGFEDFKHCHNFWLENK